MQIQPAFNAGPAGGTQSISFPTQSGGTSPGGVEGLRADWNVRMNLSHATGFVGGAGRLLVHNLVVDEKRDLLLLLPAASSDKPGRLELASAQICSAKPGIAAAPGQSLAFRTEGARVIVTIPVLQLNDWIYIDFTWTGGFAEGGLSYAASQVPVGDFHPQIAVPVTAENGQPGLAPVPSRYDVELGADHGAVLRIDSPEGGGASTKQSPDGQMTMHEFKCYGAPRIEATIAPGGSAAG